MAGNVECYLLVCLKRLKIFQFNAPVPMNISCKMLINSDSSSVSGHESVITRPHTHYDMNTYVASCHTQKYDGLDMIK